MIDPCIDVLPNIVIYLYNWALLSKSKGSII